MTIFRSTKIQKLKGRFFHFATLSLMIFDTTFQGNFRSYQAGQPIEITTFYM